MPYKRVIRTVYENNERATGSPHPQPSTEECVVNGVPPADDSSDTMRVIFPRECHDKTPLLAPWAGYFKKTMRERTDQLHLSFPHLDTRALSEGLPSSVADIMVENCVGTLSLPVGVAPNFVINGFHFVVPMCVEEPSVIAACSSISKLVARSGGFEATSSGNVMTAQIRLLDVTDAHATAELIRAKEDEIMLEARTFCQSMEKRGGGVVGVEARVVTPRKSAAHMRHSNGVVRRAYVVVHVMVDVCEAMGANVVNTVAEGVAPLLEQLTGGRAAMKILSNLCTHRRSLAAFRIPVDRLAWKGVPGSHVAERIIEAYQFAWDDPFRAATNNKGVMNGIDAVALATGQDWRAIEAAAHCFASTSPHDGQYSPLADYWIEQEASGAVLVGRLELPLSVGSAGGALHTHPTYRLMHELLGNPDACTLAQIMVSVGLAQNFAAMRALAIEGIQKGHMALHARNIAAAANVPPNLIAEVSAYMRSRHSINVSTAREYMKTQKLYSELHTSPPAESERVPVTPSTFYVRLESIEGLDEPLVLSVAMASLTTSPVHVVVADGSQEHALHSQLLGEGHGPEWLHAVYSVMARIRLTARAPRRATANQSAKLKLMSILLNLVCNHLLGEFPQQTHAFLTDCLSCDVFQDDQRAGVISRVPRDVHVLAVGFPLILSLWQVFEYHVEQWVAPSHSALASALKREQRSILETFRDRCSRSCAGSQSRSRSASCVAMSEFMKLYCKRFQATMMLLCDALAISPQLLTGDRMDFIHLLGDYWEYEGTVSHDVSRAQRDRKDEVPNVYLVWLDAERMALSEDSMFCFLRHVDDVLAKKRAGIFQKQTPEHFFDVRLFVRLCTQVRQHYNVPITHSFSPDQVSSPSSPYATFSNPSSSAAD